MPRPYAVPLLVAFAACAEYRVAAVGAGVDAGGEVDAGSDPDAGVLLGPAADLGADVYGAAVRGDRPIAWFRFDEPRNATTLVDSAGTRTGSVGAGSTTGRAPLIGAGYALALDGTGGSSFPDLSFKGTAPFTFEVWFLATRIDDVFRRLVAHEYKPGESPVWQGFNLSLTVDKLEFDRIVNGAPCGPASRGTAKLRNAAHLAVATFDGAKSMLYLDGSLVDTGSCASPLVDLPAYPGFFGRTENGSSFEGALDEIAFYDYPLGADRIAAHFQAGQYAGGK